MNSSRSSWDLMKILDLDLDPTHENTRDFGLMLFLSVSVTIDGINPE